MFNIAGNKYRMVVWINYQHRIVYVSLSARKKITTRSTLGRCRTMTASIKPIRPEADYDAAL
jgi:hypothetical protein